MSWLAMTGWFSKPEPRHRTLFNIIYIINLATSVRVDALLHSAFVRFAASRVRARGDTWNCGKPSLFVPEQDTILLPRANKSLPVAIPTGAYVS